MLDLCFLEFDYAFHQNLLVDFKLIGSSIIRLPYSTLSIPSLNDCHFAKLGRETR